MVGQILHLFTASFPLGTSPERIFVTAELPALATHFEEVRIYPGDSKGELEIVLPDNVKVCSLDFKQLGVMKLTLSDYRWVVAMIAKELKRNPSIRSLSNIRELRARLVDVVKKGKLLHQTFSFDKKDLCYTFWWEEWNYALSYLKDRKIIENKLVTKAHGFDLFDERNKFGKIPFREMQLKRTDRIFSISETGKAYLMQRFPNYAEKFTVSRIGTFDHGIGADHQGAQLLLVSCSSISQVKQLHLIPELLNKVKRKVKWVHFGDGPERPKVVSYIEKLPKHITVELKGNTPNEEILEYYKNHGCSVFINVSESEGIPVSMMEAISFGIPLIGFDVGGVSEIVTNDTGYLITPDDQEEIARILNEFDDDPAASNQFRTNVRLFWKTHFSAESNSAKFVDKLKQL